MMEKKKPIRKSEYPSSQHDRLVAIGRVIKPRGLGGELKVEPLTDVAGRFENLRTAFLELNDGTIVSGQLEAAKKNGNVVIVKFKDIDDRNAAELLQGAFISVERRDVAQLPHDSYYIFELEGMEVYNSEGVTVGRVLQIERYPANDVIVVEMEHENIMIPAVKEYILEINSKDRYMTVDIPEGLPVFPKGKR